MLIISDPLVVNVTQLLINLDQPDADPPRNALVPRHCRPQAHDHQLLWQVDKMIMSEHFGRENVFEGCLFLDMSNCPTYLETSQHGWKQHRVPGGVGRLPAPGVPGQERCKFPVFHFWTKDRCAILQIHPGKSLDAEVFDRNLVRNTFHLLLSLSILWFNHLSEDIPWNLSIVKTF